MAAVDDAALRDLYARSGAGRWGVAPAVLGAAVARAVSHRFGDAAPDAREVRAFVDGLHADDLALACACADGHPDAWDHFVLTFRPELYRAARAIAGEADHRELADSLYAELYGLPGADGRRRSLLAYYHGRSKLTTWLRSVLSQRHVDRVRARRPTMSLDDPERPTPEPAGHGTAPDPERSARVRAISATMTEVLAELEPADRLRLSYYYVHRLTLARIGRLMGEHEATVSRKLDKARKYLKGAIERALRARGVDPAEVDDWGRVARHEWDGQLSVLIDEPPVQADGLRSFKGESTP